MLTSISCPNCSEQGKLQEKFLHSRIKCKKCGKTFIPKESQSEKVVPKVDLAPQTPPAAARKPGDIEVEGLEDSAWTVHPEPSSDSIATHPTHETKPRVEVGTAEASSAFTNCKAYKVMTTKDPYFNKQFDLSALEAALNHYSAQGWVVRSMGHPMLQGFSGGPKEELIIILER